ncbi:TlpA family protein disulfide reductase [Lacimicrobium alkaliphilum]|uniref:Redoxin domain-containing protein n=1 Tax=Lacimicrobium alkaliphilum TaxID=1526571 RepID=A0ABQ1RR51_9ALTE|nr:TlpA disulfide reductase family protein [Lacimicrobium alkaliphilum]GGD78620.1 hypothetical protein GCM10011357_37020 [Lacimicrobium alkaliphilum]
MKKLIVSLILLLLIATLVTAKYLGFFAPSFSSVAHNPIQRIELTDLSGTSHSFDELEGNETVIYFFTSWCAPCYKTLATLQALSQNHDLKFVLLTVALDDDLDAITRMLEKTAFSGQVWLASEGTMALQKRYFGNERRTVPYVIRLSDNTNISESAYSLNAAEWKSILVDGVSFARAKGL